MAAGMGNRMRPVTETTPKPLVTVKGRRMIDTIIQALHQNGIYEIYVVVGYLNERFGSLPEEYPGLTIVENPDYLTANNISSLYYARAHLGSCVILDGDQLVEDPEILMPEFSRSCYCGIWTEQPTEEWLLTLDGQGVVRHCSRTGGDRGWELHSVSFWTEEDGASLRKHLEYQYDVARNRDIYWDDVALFCYPEAYRLGVRPIRREALVEIDSFQELCDLDETYRADQK